jgi:hypothetical protein
MIKIDCLLHVDDFHRGLADLTKRGSDQREANIKFLLLPKTCLGPCKVWRLVHGLLQNLGQAFHGGQIMSESLTRHRTNFCLFLSGF